MEEVSHFSEKELTNKERGKENEPSGGRPASEVTIETHGFQCIYS